MRLVSVITPCYNSAEWLEATVASVFAQTWQDFELVLVDDGSTDNTRELIEAIAVRHAPRVRVVVGPNAGAATARNRGLQVATGVFIQYLDADDLLWPDAITQRVQALDASGADVAYSDWQRYEEVESGNFVAGDIMQRRMEDVDADPAIALLTSFWCPPAALLYRRSIVDRIGGWKQQLAPIEDARYMLDVVLCGGRYVHVAGIGASYRMLRAAVSHSRRSPLKFLQAVLENALDVEGLWSARGGCTPPQCVALASVYDYTARSLFVLDPALFRRALAGLYRVRPGFDMGLPKLAGLGSKCLGHGLTKRLLVAAGKLPA